MSILGGVFIFIGLLFITSGIIGIWRFPDFYTKVHAASLIESIGAPLVLLGLMFMQNSFTNICKLFFIMLSIFLLSPISTHAITKSAIKNGIIPKNNND